MTESPFVPYVPRLALGLEDPGGAVAHRLEGTLLFVDVAGFTALSERLARRGRSGAEEVTELIDTTFASLLSAAYEDGGSLLKFGGDALLLFFRGVAHAERAARAAAGMRRRPAELGPLNTSVGPVRLRMSMGMHSGTFSFLIVGDLYREIVVAGPGVSVTVAMEKAARAGEVVLSPDAAGHLGAGHVRQGPDGHYRLSRRPRPRLRSSEVSGDLGAAARFAPPWLRSHVSSVRTPEHRRLAICFIQFTGLDALIRERGDEDAAADVHHLVSAAQRAADRYDVTLLGSDIDSDGGKLFSIAGAPFAVERREERLILAAREVLAVPTRLRVRAGLTSGHVFVGDVGPPYRMTYTAMGDQVNLAARLMANAPDGTLLASDEAAYRQAFELTAMPPLTVKGKRAPVSTVQVGEPRIRADRQAQAQPVVGRDSEVARITELVAGARGGRGALLEVVGEPGSGKTRLVQEAIERAQDVRVVVLTAQPYEATTAYVVVRRLLRHLLGVDEQAPPAVARGALLETLGHGRPWARGQVDVIALLADADPGERHGSVVVAQPVGDDAADVDERRRRRLFMAAERFLVEQLDTSTLLVLEDTHWFDPSSLDLLTFVTRAIAHRPWAVLAARRPEGRGLAEEAHVMRLTGLDRAAARQILALQGGARPLSHHEVEILLDRAAGNPLFLGELAKAQASNAAGELPGSVESVISARLSDLPPQARRLLLDASVLGRQFDVDLLAAIDPVGVEDEGLWAELHGYLNRTGPECAFEHALFRDVAYETLPFRRRREIHARVGSVLEERGADAEILALHFFEARSFQRAWEYSVAAGRKAAARSAHESAAAAYQRALAARAGGRLEADPPVTDVLTALGDSLDRAGHPEQALRAFQQARRAAPVGDRQAQAALLLREGRVRTSLGQFSLALRSLNRGQALARAAGAAGSAELELARAGAYYRQGRYAPAIAVLEEVVARRTDLPDRETAHAYQLLHTSLTAAGDPRCREFRDLALPIYERLGDLAGQARALNNLGVDAYYEGRWDEARTLFDRSRLCDERDGNVVGAAIAVNNVAEILSDQGRLDQALPLLLDASATLRAAQYTVGIHLTESNLGLLAFRQGDLDQAGALLEAARAGFEEVRASGMLPETNLRLAEVALARGDLPAVDRGLARLRRDALQVPEIASSVVRLEGTRHALAGDVVAARAELERAVGVGQATAQYPRALAHRYLYGLDPAHEDADRHRRLASDLFWRLGVLRVLLPLEGSGLIDVV